MLTKISRLASTSVILLFVINGFTQYSNYKPPMQDTRGSSALNFYLGGTTFLGDLGGARGAGKPFIKDFNSQTVRPYLGVSYAYFPYSWLSVKGGLHYTAVTGADSLVTSMTGNAAGRFDRNLSFKSSVTELSAEAELYPIQAIPDYEEAGWRPFIGAGVGFFHFNPKASFAGQWIALQPLHLEGQGFPEYPERKEYKLTQLYIPLTIGLKYRVSSNYFISASAVFRKTFTDYIDDVSTSYIDPALFDKYLSPYQASLARQLYYRGKTPISNSAINLRGYGSKDSYTSVLFTITYLFNRFYY